MPTVLIFKKWQISFIKNIESLTTVYEVLEQFQNFVLPSVHFRHLNIAWTNNKRRKLIDYRADEVFPFELGILIKHKLCHKTEKVKKVCRHPTGWFTFLKKTRTQNFINLSFFWHFLSLRKKILYPRANINKQTPENDASWRKSGNHFPF